MRVFSPTMIENDEKCRKLEPYNYTFNNSIQGKHVEISAMYVCMSLAYVS